MGSYSLFDFALPNIHVQLLAACTLLCGHWHMLVNTIDTLYILYISNHSLSKYLYYLKLYTYISQAFGSLTSTAWTEVYSVNTLHMPLY